MQLLLILLILLLTDIEKNHKLYILANLLEWEHQFTCIFNTLQGFQITFLYSVLNNKSMYNEVYYLYTTKLPKKQNQGCNDGNFTTSTCPMLVTSQKWYNGISLLADVSIQAHFNQAICDVCLV